VAGYEILNEPVAPDIPTLQAFYEKVSKKIRKVDRKHIIFWEGNVFGTQFDGLSLPGKNMAFSCHIYTAADFEDFAYPTKDNDKETIAAQYKGYADFARKQKAPMWCSEWGAHQLGRTPEIRKGRLRAVEDQIEIFEGHGHSWSLWTYKDVGVMGLAMPKKSSDYMKRTRAVQKLKAQLGVDVWTADHAAFAKWTKPVLDHVKKTCGKRVPPEAVHKIMDRAIRDACGRLLMAPFAEQFRGMTKRQIDSMMKSWRFENCRINKGLARVIKRHSA
jgi:hypothetical protein